MGVITEDQLRHMFRKKKIQSGSTFVVSKDCLLTPAASSYLREHHIPLMRENLVSSPIEQSKQPLFEQETLLPSVQRKICLEIKKLKNLLFFHLLEENDMYAEGWLYLEYQQEWLANFSRFDGKTLSAHPPRLSGMIYRSPLQRRILRYSINEIEYQVEKVSQLLEAELPAYLAIFMLWAEELQSIIQLPKNE
ncbi:hypothetical protein JZO83_08630 [Enterococcus sp. DIV1298c]|uniref:hypothetical protein n=1 Tax=Enterococcus sp. DIV1298c TaxID=2815328 RepID=UPI001A917E9F|nr:hypothetical protein [Enterococcus sp. DIV1298c]MBO0461815.1 hypothetical protein [Enterococcus sp. DIV1298c]